MTGRKQNELLAGLFVMASLAAALGIVLWLGASDIFKPARARAFFYVDENDGSTGLKIGNFVQIADKEIGRIVDIRYVAPDRRTLYEVEIDLEGAEIHSDAQARVSAGLVGDARLVITSRGTPQQGLADQKNPAHLTGGIDTAIGRMASIAERLNAFAAKELDREQPDALLAKMHAIADNLKAATTAMAEIAANVKPETDPDNQKSLLVQAHQTIGNMKDASAKLKAIAEDAEPKVSAILTSAASAAGKLDEYSKKDIAELFTTLRNANDKILAIANDFAAVSEATRKIVVLNRDNIDTMIDNMTQVSATLKAAAQEIRANPWRLTYRPGKDEMRTQGLLAAAAAFSEGASSLDQAISKLKNLDPKVFKPDDPQVRKIREHLDEAFKRFKEVEDALYKDMQAKPQ